MISMVCGDSETKDFWNKWQ